MSGLFIMPLIPEPCCDPFVLLSTALLDVDPPRLHALTKNAATTITMPTIEVVFFIFPSSFIAGLLHWITSQSPARISIGFIHQTYHLENRRQFCLPLNR